MCRMYSLIAIIALFLFGAAANPKQPELPRIDNKISQHLLLAKQAFQKEDYSQTLAEADLILLQGPIKIFIDTSGLDAPYSSSYEIAMERGMNNWNKALPGEKLFQLVDTKTEAQISVRFYDQLHEGDKHICGHVNWKRKLLWNSDSSDAVVSMTAEVSIAKYENANGKMHDPSSIQHIITHELGHVLGLDDSLSRTDIMGPDVHGARCPDFGKEELAAIKDLRSQCLKLRAIALSKLNRNDESDIAYRNVLAIAPGDLEAQKHIVSSKKSESAK